MERLFWAKHRPVLVRILLASLLLMCLGGLGINADADDQLGRAFINDDPELIQVYSPNKLEISKIEAEAVVAVAPHDNLCEFFLLGHFDQRPADQLIFSSHCSQAPPTRS